MPGLLIFSALMQLSIRQVLPDYFENKVTDKSEIWGKQLDFDKGDYIKIVAPSGSGKSSLVSFLYGLRKEYKGSILYDGKSLATFGPEDLSRYRKDHLSIVFQGLRLFPDRTARENIEIKRQLHPFHPEKKATEMAEQLGVADKLSSLCRTCSFGEQQRIAIIRALMQPFDFLLLDEPFSHLDNPNAEKAMKLILEECRLRNASIILAELERLDYFPFTHLYHL